MSGGRMINGGNDETNNQATSERRYDGWSIRDGVRRAYAGWPNLEKKRRQEKARGDSLWSGRSKHGWAEYPDWLGEEVCLENQSSRWVGQMGEGTWPAGWYNQYDRDSAGSPKAPQEVAPEKIASSSDLLGLLMRSPLSFLNYFVIINLWKIFINY